MPTIIRFQLGWNSDDTWFSRSEWGYPDHPDQKIWAPRGFVIPSFTFKTKDPIKVKIRRTEWLPEDNLPKYVEISGSMQTLSVYGDPKHGKILIVESELDAILIQQYASDLICCIALGGASKKPDEFTDYFIKQAKMVLLSLDMDEAGQKAYKSWKTIYPQSKIWPCPNEKSPGDAFIKGLDIRKWVMEGLKNEKLPDP